MRTSILCDSDIVQKIHL